MWRLVEFRKRRQKGSKNQSRKSQKSCSSLFLLQFQTLKIEIYYFTKIKNILQNKKMILKSISTIMNPLGSCKVF